MKFPAKSLYFITFFLLKSYISPAIHIEQLGFGNYKSWLISKETPNANNKRELIIFLHGFTASNALCYGGWIKNLTDEGYIVLYPKFQTGIYFPRTIKYQERVDHCIKQSINLLNKKFSIKIEGISFSAHSIGGIIAANLSNEYGFNGAHKVKSITLVQPGFKYINFGVLKKYNHIEDDVKILGVSGSMDKVAGNKFIRHLFSTTPQISEKVHLEQLYASYNEEEITSKHKDPVSIDLEVSTKNWNPVIWLATILGKTDKGDVEGYWRLNHLLLEAVQSGTKLADIPKDELIYMGEWDDGSSIQGLRIVR